MSTAMKHKTSSILYSYWNKVRGDRVTPRRFEIEPAQIAAILPATFILERVDTETFRYRLAGTRICDIFGVELRGTNFLDGWSAEDRLSLIRHFVAVAKQGAVELVHLEAAPAAKLSAPFEVLLLPLQQNGDAIDRVLGSFCPLDEPSWLGELPLISKRLIANELIWPAGGAKVAEESLKGHVPMLFPTRHARIVRTDRRHFRVFEGGLGRSDADES